MDLLTFLASVIPLIALVFLLHSLIKRNNIYSLIVLCIVWLTTIFLWKLPISQVMILSVRGLFESIEPLWTLFGTLFFVFVLMKASIFDMLTYYFHRITPDIRLQALLVGVLFATLLQALFGFGIPVIVCTLMLYSLGFTNKQSIIISLLGTAFSVSFGSLSNGLASSISGLTTSNVFNAIYSDPESYISNVAKISGLMTYVIGLILPIIIMYYVTVVFNKCSKKDFREILPFTIIISLVYLLSSTVIAYFISYKFAGLFPSVITIIIAVIMIHYQIMLPDLAIKKKDVVTMSRSDVRIMHVLLPFAVFVVASFIVYISEPLNGLLKSYTLDFPSYEFLNGASFEFLTSPGTICFILGLIMIIVYRLKIDETEQIVNKLYELFIIFLVPFLSIMIVCVIFSSSFGGIAGTDSMSMYLSEVIANIFGPFWGFLSPFFGALGTMLTGNTTTGDLLFSRLQFDVAALSDLNTLIIGASHQIASFVGGACAILPIVITTEVLYYEGANRVILFQMAKIVGAFCFLLGVLTTILLYFL